MKKDNSRLDIENLLKRIIFYILGLFVLAIGVVFSIYSNLGVSPVNSLPYVFSLITGKEMSICIILIFSIYILVQMLILRKEFKWINLTQLIFSSIFGYFVDLTKNILGNISITSYPIQLLFLAISILLVAIGMSLYLNADLINMPMEGMTIAIQQKVLSKWSYYDVKVLLDCIVVGIGIILSFAFKGKLVGIREGIVLSALLIGWVMKKIEKVIKQVVEKICD